MDYGAAASFMEQATDHFYNLGNPDKFFADRAASEWVSFTLTTKDHLLLNEIERITTQIPGNALNSFLIHPAHHRAWTKRRDDVDCGASPTALHHPKT